MSVPRLLGDGVRLKWSLAQTPIRCALFFVTVDPERDSPERLGEHLAVFTQEFVGLTGPPERLQAVYQTFGVFSEKETSTETAAGYLINHTASSFVVDRDGRWRLRHAFDTSVEDIVFDVRQLLR